MCDRQQTESMLLVYMLFYWKLHTRGPSCVSQQTTSSFGCNTRVISKVIVSLVIIYLPPHHVFPEEVCGCVNIDIKLPSFVFHAKNKSIWLGTTGVWINQKLHIPLFLRTLQTLNKTLFRIDLWVVNLHFSWEMKELKGTSARFSATVVSKILSCVVFAFNVWFVICGEKESGHIYT